MYLLPIITFLLGAVIELFGNRIEDSATSLSVMGTGLIIIILSAIWIDLSNKGEK